MKSTESFVPPSSSLRIVVTGASRGIGRAIAVECARRGAVVGANYRASDADAESLRAEYPDRIHLMKFDVRDALAAEAAIDAFSDVVGVPDVLVNNAGQGGRPQYLIRLGLERLGDIIATNLLGTAYCTRAALRHMTKARHGHVVNISSISACTPLDGMTVYAATKAGVEVLASSVAKEYANRGIQSHAVRFGLVRTDMTKALIDALPPERAATVHEPAEIAAFVADLVFGRISYPSGTAIDYPPQPVPAVAAPSAPGAASAAA